MIKIQEAQLKNNLFYNIAISSLIISIITVALLIISTPLLYYKVNLQKDSIFIKSIKFREETNRIWKNFKIIPENKSILSSPMQFFSRKARSAWEKHICSGCNQLGCQAGSPGLPGASGEDGNPGMAGKSGSTGEDGFDVELQPENDLPCIICPAGPPGKRGMQGERGQVGYRGIKGVSGPPGSPGVDGPAGNPGSIGHSGKTGLLGPMGPPGDITISGTGIRGPKGPPGPAGPIGPHGPNGKSSKEQGMTGKPGLTGATGPYGNPGQVGEKGGWGLPGEPGQPAAYCLSDCGVSHILTPAFRSNYENPDEVESSSTENHETNLYSETKKQSQIDDYNNNNAETTTAKLTPPPKSVYSKESSFNPTLPNQNLNIATTINDYGNKELAPKVLPPISPPKITLLPSSSGNQEKKMNLEQVMIKPTFVDNPYAGVPSLPIELEQLAQLPQHKSRGYYG